MHKLEELLNLSDSREIIDETIRDQVGNDANATKLVNKHVAVTKEYYSVSNTQIPPTDLPSLGFCSDSVDAEFDSLAKRATDAYDDLMDLGMNVEARFSGRIFEVAASMLKNAIEAKSAKIDKRLKTIDLQLKKQRQDHEISRQTQEQEPVIQGDGYVVSDRNSLIEKLRTLEK